jgi:methylmalonyl-CoA mutase cobalamin-binding subunit
MHDRAFAGSDVSAVHVLCTVETRNREHLATLRKKLREHGVKHTTRVSGQSDLTARHRERASV